MKINLLLILFISTILYGSSAFGAIKYGNYIDARIGDIENQTMDQLLFFPDREWLYDFDTEVPLQGVTASASAIDTSTAYYMTSPQSMLWTSAMGASLTLDANIILPYVWPHQYMLTVGLFQEDIPTGNDQRIFKIECLSNSDVVLCTRIIYLRKGGWNILSSDIVESRSIAVAKVRITQTAGTPGNIFVDNFMIHAQQNSTQGVATKGIESEKLAIENKDNYPTKELTQEEKDAFLSIAERVIPLPSKTASISIETMDGFRLVYKRYNITIKGKYANGVNPLYYYRSLDKLDQESNPTLQYRQNANLCQQIKEMGKAWYQTNDTSQKAELGKMVSELVRLATTYGGMPNAWYNGSGFAAGVYYAKELLEQEGLLAEVTDQLIQQYSVAEILYREHRWDLLLDEGKDGSNAAGFWKTTCDDLNTASLSTMLCVLVGADNPEKARNLYRMKSWLDNIALTYAPTTEGALKPDGSWFHHWGNRFDNYGWVAGWRGATDYVWWFSHTPFQLNTQTYERMHHMADIHFEVMNKDAYVGPQDNMEKNFTEGFMSLAIAGSADGSSEIDSVMGAYWLAYPNDYSYKYNSDWVSKVKAAGIVAATKQQTNTTLSYDISNVHRWENWQVYTRGLSDASYHTQYVRDGFLFYNIGGISLCKEGEATGMQNKYGSSLLLRHEEDYGNITPGYNFSRAPGVTSLVSDDSELRQISYQKGTSPFVGGLSTENNNGIFVQEFDDRTSGRYSGRPAQNLRFKKSYFYFGNDIIALASGISNNQGTTNIETGLMQEPVSFDKNLISFSNSSSSTNSTYNKQYNSTDVPWMYNNTHRIGVYLTPNQKYRLFKGEQTFGLLKGDIISTYLEHGAQETGWYEFIMRLNTSSGDMKDLNEKMMKEDPIYKVSQRNDKAHIVYSSQINSTGFAIFDPTGIETHETPLLEVNKPCVIMIQELKGEGQLILTVADPDKNFSITDENPMGWSVPSEIEISLKGKYQIIQSNSENVNLSVDEVNKTTNVTFVVKDGLSSEIKLQENREKNSLPWIEDFSWPNETIVDDGLSSWSLVAFESQEIGYAYVEDYALVMSGTNCNWESGHINISTENKVDIFVKAHCQEPLRINGNDSLSIFYSIDNQPRQLLINLVDDFEAQEISIQGLNGDSLQIFIEARIDKNNAAYVIDEIRVQKTIIELTGIEISPQHKEMMVGEEFTPSIIFTPANADDQRYTLISGNPDIISLSDQEGIQALKQGIAKVIVSSNNEAYHDTLEISVSYPGLPSPWIQYSLGNSNLAETQVIVDEFTIKANGQIIGGETDHFHYVYQEVIGDFAFVAKLENFLPNSTDAQAGIMLREELTDQSRNVALIYYPLEGTAFQYRPIAEDVTQVKSGIIKTLPCWLKLERVDSRIASYESTNGTDWNPIRSTSIDLKDTLFIGMAVSGKDGFSTATFQQVLLEKKGITAVGNVTSSNSINVYPNPASSEIRITNNDLQTITSLELFNIQGQKIFSKPCQINTGQGFAINLEKLSLVNGQYFLKIYQKETISKTVKFIIE